MSTTRESVRTIRKKVVERVACRVYLSGNQADLTAGSWNKVNFNTRDYDLGLNFDTTLFKFVVPVTGLYKISALVHFVPASVIATRDYGVAIYKNGVAISYNYSQSSVASDMAAGVEDEVFLLKDDEIEIYANPDAGANTVDVLSGLTNSRVVIRLITKEGTRQ